MNNCEIHIALLEPSDIICEGLSASLLSSQDHYVIHRMYNLNELETRSVHTYFHVIIVNPIMAINRGGYCKKLRNRLANSSWIGLIYSLFTPATLTGFDEIISVTESREIISQKVKALVGQCPCDEEESEELTEREKEVLTLLTQGCSNKDIAAKLFISVHTVISHRKNLVEKTGIKSLSGLTIYAITKKIISLST
ncbi:MAG: helix-turn-helix transcriptional regulator [Bacteroidales bacterium]|nr:helix-turn-helix transcriptional regulator [Bacteroidales bacterium]